MVAEFDGPMKSARRWSIEWLVLAVAFVAGATLLHGLWAIAAAGTGTAMYGRSMWWRGRLAEQRIHVAAYERMAQETNVVGQRNIEEIDRNARAYGYEVGRGAPLAEQVGASPDNPFLRKDWRDLVGPDGEQRTD